jgi:hypothetical protein
VASIKRRHIEAALVKKGMIATRDQHHVMFRKWVEIPVEGLTRKRVLLTTRLSHGSGEVGDFLAEKMGKQCALQLKEFWSLVDCTLDADHWDAVVRTRCPDGSNPLTAFR